MGKRRKQSGVRIYQEPGRTHENRDTNAPEKGFVFLWAVRAFTVWFAALAWLKSVFSVLELKTNQSGLYAVLFLFAGLWIWILTSARRKYYIPAAAVICIGLIWQYRGTAAAVLNSLANSWLRFANQGVKHLMVYKDLPVTRMELSVGIAFAVLPLIIVWGMVLVRQRGKILAAVLMLLPVAASASVGYIPSDTACWMQVAAAGIYFAVCACKSGRSAVTTGVCMAVLMTLLILTASAAGRFVDAKKQTQGSAYLRTRAVIREEVINKLVRQTQKKTKDKTPQTVLEDQRIVTDQGQTPADDNRAVEQGAGDEDFSAGDLKAIAAFKPEAGTGLTVNLEEKPTDTVYYATHYGRVYDGGSWSEESEDEEMDERDLQYPNLFRLIALCDEQTVNSAQEAAAFIQKEFEENTVYDYEPGPTPQDQDFAEYFLFENKKGFCVHFATTAVLMYRIFGYPARYVEGYAIPASAFALQEDGSYLAQITGQMGHAWCETYDKGWQIREHTLPYEGEEKTPLIPAASSNSSQQEQRDSGRVRLLFAGAAALFLLCAGILFFVQAAVRRKKRYYGFRIRSDARGVLNVYQNLYDMAVFRGMSPQEPLKSAVFEELKVYFPGIREEDWDLLKNSVLELLFYGQIPDKETQKNILKIRCECAKQAETQLRGWKKIKYKYLKAL